MRSLSRKSFIISILTIIISSVVGVRPDAIRDGQHHREHHLREAAQDLGVASVQLYAKAPILDRDKVLLLNVWLKRATPVDNTSGNLALNEHAVHGFAWAEDLSSLNRNQDGHLLMGVDQNVWQPRLRLETPRGAIVGAQSGVEGVSSPIIRSSLRPFHFTFILDAKFPGRCYKIYEESFPGFKASFCLPTSSLRICRRLLHAGPTAHLDPAVGSTAGSIESAGPGSRALKELSAVTRTPALWSMIFPVRIQGINGTHWEYQLRLAANRIYNYALYQIGIGGAGVLVYADRLTRSALERLPRLGPLIARGRLLLVGWELPERAPLARKYDQALVASHALLGLSACGPDLRLLLSDLDEYLYSPKGGGWPAIASCLSEEESADATVFRLQRIEARSSRLEPAREHSWWVLPARSLSRHPLLAYDRLAQSAVRAERSKVLAVPAARVVGFYVYDGVPLLGKMHLASGRCAFLMHVPNYWRRRGKEGDEEPDWIDPPVGDDQYTPFKMTLPWTSAGQMAAAEVYSSLGTGAVTGAGATRGGSYTGAAGAARGGGSGSASGGGMGKRGGQAASYDIAAAASTSAASMSVDEVLQAAGVLRGGEVVPDVAEDVVVTSVPKAAVNSGGVKPAVASGEAASGGGSGGGGSGDNALEWISKLQPGVLGGVIESGTTAKRI